MSKKIPLYLHNNNNKFNDINTDYVKESKIPNLSFKAALSSAYLSK